MEHRSKEMGGLKMEEIWKDAVGWEGYYQISNMGRVRSIDRIIKITGHGYRKIKGRILITRHDKDGYLVVNLRCAARNMDKMCKCHRLVAEAFIPKIEGKDSIDHINSIRDDNRVENLRWCTNKENINFPIARKNRSIAVKNSYYKCPELRKIRSRDIGYLNCIKVRVLKDGERLGDFDSISDAAKELGLSYSSLHHKFKEGIEYKGYKLERI